MVNQTIHPSDSHLDNLDPYLDPHLLIDPPFTTSATLSSPG